MTSKQIKRVTNPSDLDENQHLEEKKILKSSISILNYNEDGRRSGVERSPSKRRSSEVVFDDGEKIDRRNLERRRIEQRRFEQCRIERL